MVKGWPNEPARHSLAARGCKTGRKGSRGRYNKDSRLYGKKIQKITDITPEQFDMLADEYDFTEMSEELMSIAKKTGFFKGIRADGEPHLKKGVGGGGIAYVVDPESNEAKIMDITSIPDATGDAYWTEKQMGLSTRWATEHDKAYVLTQLSSFEIIDLIESAIKGDRFVGSYGGGDNIMDLMISHQAYWGGVDEEALYHSRKEAWEDFQW